MGNTSKPSPGTSTKWQTPRASENFQNVRAELIKLGHAGQAWDSLAFSLGLLPTLFAHGRALQRIAELFATPVFQDAPKWTKRRWVDQLPSWQAMLADWEAVRARLSAPGSFLDPRRAIDSTNARRHPLRRFGIDVAPLVSALIVRHEYSNSRDSLRLAISGRFDHLQAMFTAAAIEYRWASGATVDGYLDWRPDSRHEFCSHPIESQRACRTVRWLSEVPQAPLLESMGRASEPRKFLRELRQWESTVTPDDAARDPPPPGSADEFHRRTYPSALTSYLDYWPEILSGVTLAERPERTGGGGSGGGGAGVEGYVPGIAPAAAAEAAAPGKSLGELPHLTSLAEHEGTSTTEDTAPVGGIADEDVAPVRLPLVSPSEIDAILSGQKWRAMRAAMADTVTPFDIRYLPASDADRLARHALALAEAALAPSLKGPNAAEEPMLVLLTLALGQPPAILAKTRLAVVHPTAMDAKVARSRAWSRAPVVCLEEALNLQLDAPLLLVWPGSRATDEKSDESIDGQHPWPLPSDAIGFLIPAVRPHLASSDSSDAEFPLNSRQVVRNLLIPAGAVGRLLATYHRSGGPHSLDWNRLHVRSEQRAARNALPESESAEAVGLQLFRSFDAKTSKSSSAARLAAEVIEQRVADFLNGAAGCPPPPGHVRWSVQLLQELIPAHIEATSGDRTLAWLLACDPSASSQARLYYTQHTLARLSTAWVRAMHSAGLEVLVTVPASSTQAGAANDDPTIEAGPSAEGSAAATRLPATWPWRAPILADSRVGAGVVATTADVRRLIKILQTRTSAPVALERRSDLRTHHRHLLLLTIVYQGLCTAMRALRSPVTLLRAVEQADRMRGKAGLPPVEEVFVGLADKESLYNQRARLVALPPILVRQLRILQSHQIALVARLDRFDRWQSAPTRVRAMFRLDKNDSPTEVSVAWVEKELAELGFPWPANFARAFLRTRLLERGCAAADLDALLGHRDAGGGAIGLHATFDFDSSLARLQAALASLHSDIGLKVVPSALIAGTPFPDKEVLLAPMHRAGPVGRGRSDRPRQQGRVPGLSDFWQAIHLRATDDDRRQVMVLFRILRSWAHQGNMLARLLCAPDPRAFALAQGLVSSGQHQRFKPADSASAPDAATGSLAAGGQDIVARLTYLAESATHARFHLAASWFRLLVHAQLKLKRHGVEVPSFPMVAIVRPPSSPFVEQAVLSVPIVDGWRFALLNWMELALAHARAWRAKPSPDPLDVSLLGNAMPMPVAPSVMAAEGWATALTMSAVLNGMLLDLTQVSMLLRRFSAADGRDLPLSGPCRRAHLDFHVAAGGAMDRQTHRWWFDPLTEMIWLNAPPMPRELRLGDLHPWLRRIALMVSKGSVAMPIEPHSFSDLIRCAEVWWLTRASRTVVASQRRQIDASSILTERWGRLVGARRLVAPDLLDSQGTEHQPTGAPAPANPLPESGRRRRRRAVITTESGFSQLALVRSAGERGLDQSAAWDPEPGDAELLASLAAAHPWIEQVARALTEVSGTSPPWDLGSLRQVLRPDQTERIDVLIEFALWLADPVAGAFTGPPLVRTFTAAAQALALHGELAADSGALLPETIARILREADDLPLSAGATLRSIRQAMRKLAQYLKIEAAVLALLSTDELEELEGDDHASHADACVLSLEEHDQIQRALDEGLYPGLTRGDRTLGRLLLTLCFRLALRPGEVYGLRLRDVTVAAIYVLPYGSHTLKSNNARRRVPLGILMPRDESERLQKFVLGRLTKGASPDDLLLAQPSTGPASRQRLDRWVHRVMRDVTMDPGMRLYHSRHSLSTWADLALRAVDHPEVLRFFDGLPQTTAFLRQGKALACALFGSPQAAMGRTSFALARLVGHVGPAVTHMHYIHGDDLVRAAVVEREARRIDKTVWMQLTGLARSTTFALCKEGNFMALMDHERRAIGWRTRPVELVGDRPRGVGTSAVAASVSPETSGLLPEESRHGKTATAAGPNALYRGDWISVTRTCEISNAVASGKRTVEQVAAAFGLDPHRVAALMASLRRWLPEVAQPGHQATAAAARGLATLTLSPETSRLMQRAEANTCARGLRDPVGLSSDLEFAIRCYDRRDRDFHVRNAEGLQRLSQVALTLGMEPTSTALVARTSDPSNQDVRLPSWVRTEGLGIFAGCQVRAIRVRSAGKAASYARWLGLMPLTTAQEGCGSSYAVLAALVKAALDASMV